MLEKNPPCTHVAMAKYFGVSHDTIARRIKKEGLNMDENKKELPIGQHSRESVDALFHQWFMGRMGETEVFTVRLDPTQNEIRFAGKKKPR